MICRNVAGHAVEFDEEQHRYLVDGQPWPNVTTILTPIRGDLSAVPPEILERSRLWGVAVHKMVELEVRGELDEADLDEPLKPVLIHYRNAMASVRLTATQAERMVLHPTHRYIGTLDLIAERDGKRALIDIKTGSKAPLVGPQTAAYAECVRAEDGTKLQRFCLYLRRDGYRWQTLDDPADFIVLQSCLNIHRFKEKHSGTAKPTT